MRSGNTTEYRALLWATTERAAPTASAAGGAFSARMSRYWPKATSVVMRAKARRAARLARGPTCAQASAKASVDSDRRKSPRRIAEDAPKCARSPLHPLLKCSRARATWAEGWERLVEAASRMSSWIKAEV